MTMTPNNEQIKQLDELRKKSIMHLPADGYSLSNLYHQLIDNRVYICPTCPTSIGIFKEKLLRAYDNWLAQQVKEEPTPLQEAEQQVKELKEEQPELDKKEIEKLYGKRINSYEVKGDYVHLNGAKQAQLIMKYGKLYDIRFLDENDLINNIMK